MKDQILKLRSQGLSYKQIRDELGCSLSTISYHCGDKQADKTLNRTTGLRKSMKGILSKKRSWLKNPDWSVDELLVKIGENPICYLTGVPIDLLNPSSYHLDHIIPLSKGGTDKLENINIATRSANLAKNDLTLDEFYNLCELVLKIRY